MFVQGAGHRQAQPPNHSGSAWLIALGWPDSLPKSLPLDVFMSRLATEHACANMLAQCCVVGQHLDYVVQRQSGLPARVLGAHRWGRLEARRRPLGVRVLAEHIRVLRGTGKGPIEISLALDKSRPNGLGWGSVVMFYNEADMGFWCIPQSIVRFLFLGGGWGQ